jgi:hypothetical protein
LKEAGPDEGRMIAYQLIGFIIEGNYGNEKYMKGYGVTAKCSCRGRCPHLPDPEPLH